MRATGIVRRIDDLGRVVIPKEIRKVLKIREGEPLEIFTAKNNEIILKKYSPIGELNEFAQEYAESLGETLGAGIVITDLDSIIAISKVPKKDYQDKEISRELEDIIQYRETRHEKGDTLVPIHRNDPMEYSEQIIFTIVSALGNNIGAIIMLAKENNTLGKNEEQILKVAANFLGKQVQQ